MVDDWIKRAREEREIDQTKANVERRFSVGAYVGQTCETCVYWRLALHGREMAHCVRHAPTAAHNQYFAAEGSTAIDWSNKIFPMTFHDDWCGDWEQKPK